MQPWHKSWRKFENATNVIHSRKPRATKNKYVAVSNAIKILQSEFNLAEIGNASRRASRKIARLTTNLTNQRRILLSGLFMWDEKIWIETFFCVIQAMPPAEYALPFL